MLHNGCTSLQQLGAVSEAKLEAWGVVDGKNVQGKYTAVVHDSARARRDIVTFCAALRSRHRGTSEDDFEVSSGTVVSQWCHSGGVRSGSSSCLFTNEA